MWCSRSRGGGGYAARQAAASPAFVNLLHLVYEQGSGHAAPKQSLYQVLRCLNGKSGLKHAFCFHYDSYVVTALLPVIIPSVSSFDRSPIATGPFLKTMDDQSPLLLLLRIFRFGYGYPCLQESSSTRCKVTCPGPEPGGRASRGEGGSG